MASRKSATVTVIRTAAKIEVAMNFTKETPGTYRFDAVDPDAPITNVYVKKAGMPDGAPKTITVIAQ
jgi:hypothetical protein